MMHWWSRSSQCCECRSRFDLVQWASCPKIGYICRTCICLLGYDEYMISLQEE